MENWAENDIEEVLISEEQIQKRVKELAHQISEEYAGKEPIFVGALKGVVVFFADFLKRVETPCTIGFVWLSSYGRETTSSGVVKMKRAVSENLTGRHVIILEDIFDTGRSLQSAYEYVLEHDPASVKICTLLDKPDGHLPYITVRPDYTGFTIPDKFVVGYGLDYAERYRNLPYVGVLKPEVYEK